MNQSKEILIEGIEADAQQEEEKILAAAGQQAADKRKYGAQKVEAVLAEARRRASTQAEEIRRKAASGVELEVKRRSLRLRDSIQRALMQRVEERMKTRISDPAYRAVLVEWMVEAARGLNMDAAEVNASEAERELIDDALLREARARLDNQVELSLSAAEPLEQQGVVLTSTNRRLAFNNQVRTRIQRRQREIQTLIHKALFETEEARNPNT